MGKKRAKKGKGAEKTIAKTEKKASKRLRNALETQGEEDVEKIIVGYQLRSSKRIKLVESKCPPPSPRCNASLTAHPDKDELIMFGGEYFNGNQSVVFDNLYIYHIKNNEWTELIVPNCPPPRCAHQAVATRNNGGQLWIFGGEFSSPSESQFYHYRDLWVFNLKERIWENVSVSGGPSARSGHRMVACKKHLIVFGGFHDNLRDYKYFNDLYAFSLENYSWSQLVASGMGPCPRSGCMMAVTQDQNHLVIVGGYSKERVKKDVDLGKTHSDMFLLSPDNRCKDEAFPSKWKWSTVKQSGLKPGPRCGASLVATAGYKALLFGGVEDEEEDEESLKGKFFNDLFCLELDKGKWHQITLRGKSALKPALKTKRSKAVKESETSEDMDIEEEEDDEDYALNIDEEIDSLTLGDASTAKVANSNVITQTLSDGIFTVTVKSEASPGSTLSGKLNEIASAAVSEPVAVPSARMKALMVVHKSVVYLYGGVYEQDDRQYTLGDLHCLNLHRLDFWQTLYANDEHKMQEWAEESESDGSSSSDEESNSSDDDTDNDDDEEAESQQQENDVAKSLQHNKPTATVMLNSEDNYFHGAPAFIRDETTDSYWSRTETFWLQRARDVASKENMQVTDRQVLKAAKRMAKEFCEQR